MQKQHEIVWSGIRVGWFLAVIVAVGTGLISAWLTPRGPVTTTQALVSIAMALLVGALVGFLTGSRWSLLVTPVTFIVVFELARMGVDGPTVDGIHLDSMYGMIAFVLGRIFHGILVLIPMMLGMVYGIWFANRSGREGAARIGNFGWLVTALTTIAVVGIAFLIARPAKTAPITRSDGKPLPDSISELTTVSLGGHDQALMIRGRNTQNPVLLYLAGGPGGTDIGAMRADVTLEQHFVVVTWEQRGAGKSYPALDPAETLTLEQVIADTIEVTDYLRERFDEDKIYLVGNSWGTTLGVLAVQQHPERYHAFVGTGQMVSLQATDLMFYEDTLAWAEQTGNDALLATLRQNGPPPYDYLLEYEPALSHEHDWNPYPELDMSREMPAILFVPENNFMDRINGFRGFLDTFAVLYPQLQEIDFRHDVPRLEVPVYVVLGKHEARGRDVLAREWFKMLEAPSKVLIVFEHSGHRPLFEEPAKFASLMTRIKDETFGTK
jgi:pimeloyl-ACP methyl ester carboxylesterase